VEGAAGCDTIFMMIFSEARIILLHYSLATSAAPCKHIIMLEEILTSNV
jgi:hypothetical protein